MYVGVIARQIVTFLDTVDNTANRHVPFKHFKQDVFEAQRSATEKKRVDQGGIFVFDVDGDRTRSRLRHFNVLGHCCNGELSVERLVTKVQLLTRTESF